MLWVQGELQEIEFILIEIQQQDGKKKYSMHLNESQNRKKINEDLSVCGLAKTFPLSTVIYKDICIIGCLAI